MVICLNLVLVLEVIIVFAGIMFIHELGHFIFAKKAGIFVREFSLGLGPKLFSFKKGETQYSLRILPFGAYVRMAGEDPEVTDVQTGQSVGLGFSKDGKVTDIYLDNKSNDFKIEDYDFEHKLYIKVTNQDGQEETFKLSRETIIHYDKKKKVQIAPWDRQFGSKSVLARFKSVLAGPVFNIILAIILFMIIALMIGVPGSDFTVGEVLPGSSAEQADLRSGDVVLGVDDLTYQSYTDILKTINNSANKEITLRVEREGSIEYVPITPLPDENGYGKLGIKAIPNYKDASLLEAISSSFKKTVDLTVLILDGFGKLITGNFKMDDLAGPVGIVGITKDYAKQGLINLLDWTGILSLYLGIFNLLPIPALDGSRLMFLTIEGIRRKPIDPRRESLVHFIGFAVLMLLMIVVTINDISRFFK